MLVIVPHWEKFPVLSFQFAKTANQIDSGGYDYYGGDGVDDGDDFGVPSSIGLMLKLSLMNLEAPGLH